jgi:hypothetical protein
VDVLLEPASKQVPNFVSEVRRDKRKLPEEARGCWDSPEMSRLADGSGGSVSFRSSILVAEGI